MEDFQKLQCMNLEYRGTPDGYLQSTLGQHLDRGYYCKKTDSRCVGDYSPLFRKLTLGVVSRKVDPKIVERCPARETVEDILEKHQE